MSDATERIYERLLVLRCQAGDEEAFAELVSRYSPRLAYYLQKLLGRADQATDILQEVWFDAFKGLPRLAEPAALAAWLYRLARDRAFRHLRKKQPKCQALDDVDVAIPEDSDEYTAEDAAQVHAALDALAPDHREVLVLRFLEGMSYDDIARVTDTAVGTVRSRLHYAKRSLRQVLEKWIQT